MMPKRLAALLLVCAAALPVLGNAAGMPSGGGGMSGFPSAAATPEPDWGKRHSGTEKIKQEERENDAVDGITGSPYLLKQMYLCYHNFNGSFIDASGNTIRFFETLSKAYIKKKNCIALAFEIEADDMTGIVFKLDGEALKAIEHYKIARLAFTDPDGTLLRQILVSDVREQYTQLNISGNGFLVYDFINNTFSAEN